MSPNQPASLGAAAVRPLRAPAQVNWQRLNGIAVALLAIGLIGLLAALGAGESDRVWQVWLVNLLFFMGIAQAGVVCSCAFYLVQGRWAGAVPYRLAESFWLFLPLAVVLFGGVFIGRDHIFPWITHPLPPNRTVWLNVPFLFARDGIALLVMAILSGWFVTVSRRPESVRWTKSASDIEMPPPALRRLAPLIAILYCFTYSLFAFDLVMSLSPLWHSTLFGWWWFATCFWSAAAAMAFSAVQFRRLLGSGNTFSGPTILHDYGKLVFAFSVFWIYLSFAQYLVIWYGDFPAETFYLLVRLWHAPWSPLGWLAPILIWVVPFTVLMSVRTKKTPKILGTVAVLGLIGVWDLDYILVVPALSPNKLPFGWVELCITAGFLGAFLLCALPGLKIVASAAISGADGGE
jgi:hypothetical protein